MPHEARQVLGSELGGRKYSVWLVDERNVDEYTGDATWQIVGVPKVFTVTLIEASLVDAEADDALSPVLSVPFVAGDDDDSATSVIYSHELYEATVRVPCNLRAVSIDGTVTGSTRVRLTESSSVKRAVTRITIFEGH
jgi:hypothetical protein